MLWCNGGIAEKEGVDVVPVELGAVKAIREVVAQRGLLKGARRTGNLPLRKAFELEIAFCRFKIVDVGDAAAFADGTGVAREQTGIFGRHLHGGYFFGA